MSEVIAVLNDFGEREQIEAEVFGQIAVHVSLSGHHYAVTHLRSGMAIAYFSVHHVAINFAKRLNEWYDLDALAEGNDYELYKSVGREIKRMSKHQTRVYSIEELGGGHTPGGWKQLKGGGS